MTATWCPQMIFLPEGPRWTRPEQHVGRLDHDRTERHWQSPVFAPEGYSGTPRPPTPRLLGHVAVRQSPAPTRRLGLIKPRDPSLVSRHPLSEGRPLLAVSGSSRGWPAWVSSRAPGLSVVACHTARTLTSLRGRSSSRVPLAVLAYWRAAHAPLPGQVTPPQSLPSQVLEGPAPPVQQRLRYVHGWWFASIGGRRAATTP